VNILKDKENLIGEIFFKKGILTYEQVNAVYDYSVVNGLKFASAAIKLGYSTEKEALICLTEQIGFPGIELLNSKFKIYKDIIPFEIAMEKKILALKVSEKNLIIAISDPYDKVLIDEINFLTGKKVIAYLAIEDILLDVIQYVYTTSDIYYTPDNYNSDELFLSVISPSVMSFMEYDENTDDLIVGELLEEDSEDLDFQENEIEEEKKEKTIFNELFRHKENIIEFLKDPEIIESMSEHYIGDSNDAIKKMISFVTNKTKLPLNEKNEIFFAIKVLSYIFL